MCVCVCVCMCVGGVGRWESTDAKGTHLISSSLLHSPNKDDPDDPPTHGSHRWFAVTDPKTHTDTHHCFKRPLQRHPDASGKCCALLFSICNHSAWFTIFCLLPCVKCCARVYQIWRRRHMFEFKKGRQSENCPSMWSQHVSSSLTPTTPASSLAPSLSLGLLPS